MDSNTELNDSRLANAWAELNNHAVNGNPLHADAYRLAFADPEFLLRRETRGIRFQLEMLKPDLGQTAQGIENTVVVYGSARFIAPDEAEQQLADAEASGDDSRIARARLAVRNARYYDLARQFARVVAEHSEQQQPADRIYVCTGGGPGIMEAANRGAHDVGALNVGLNIALPHEQSGNRFISPSLSYKFHYFALRKMHFMMRAKALVAFPGGFGTLDELFEVLTLVQTGKAKPVPIVLFGTDFWKKVVNFDALVEQGTISAADLKLFHYTDDPQEAWNIVKAFYKL
ncbi:TIGR00730 family Rossman fold protein [Acidovorax sp. SUPP2522]|uniref:LOG family protein n=1 Tax=unclassified Acidovorax TaxID=2684926 RepID=UPI002349958A|nr:MULTISPECIES: TIGR00730 family Rossman fold protein [unclassified Acidovorax]WCM99686.1 TIGR00730 family Rossman fold protein [Acidovorax sp. GBBC 1281]GKS86543.1 TIGR00730 family Rossman fold protein [Acidovorax sp. SUPP1855]GKS92721.1 TIGR00730 family Rossman fold protein [Acidovorax sp. SUPP2539]GKS97955.1 TIGR00730 family Rossman fold protein [Acidovorax sp. SUPP3434]GKT14243.1 TIGR00730 family Rossman fold protein [Acidovorax sp. SUPP2522]